MTRHEKASDMEDGLWNVLVEAWTISADIGNRFDFADDMERSANVLAKQGEVIRSAQVLSSAASLRQSAYQHYIILHSLLGKAVAERSATDYGNIEHSVSQKRGSTP
jgi:hypothetical protein